jgi:hypothetical protein
MRYLSVLLLLLVPIALVCASLFSSFFSCCLFLANAFASDVPRGFLIKKYWSHSRSRSLGSSMDTHISGEINDAGSKQEIVHNFCP